MSLTQVQAVNALREAARTAPVPWLGEILTVVSTVVTTIANAKQVSEDLQALASRLTEVATVIVPALSTQPVTGDGNLAASARTVIATIRSLGTAVEKRLSQGRIQGFFSTSSAKLAIKEAEQEFELAVAGFNLCLSLSNLRISESVKPADLKTVRNQVESARREQILLIREEVKKKESAETKLSKQVLPVASNIFFGRDNEVKHLLEILLRPEGTSIAILGPGGMGKTSLALSVMHHQDITARFIHRRYFIACDAAITPGYVTERLVATLGLNKKRPLEHLRALVDKGNSPILITLDNFETPWEPSENREKLEEFLSQLTQIPNVSVMLTLRGAERPSGITWTKPFLPPLSPLNLESAIQVFTSISDTPEDDPYIRELIVAVDLVPLAITLIATQAQFMSCKELLGRWKEEKTRMVTRGYDGRLSSLDVSIQVSLDSPRFKQEPSALRLLQLLSLLPDGATDELISSLSEQGFPINVASATLLRVSFALRDTQGMLHVLSPVREYIHARLPISTADLSTALTYLGHLGARFRESGFDGSCSRVVDPWFPQASNLLSILEECLIRHSQLCLNSIIDTMLEISNSFRFRDTLSLTTHESILRKALTITLENGTEHQNARVAASIGSIKNVHPKEYDPLIALFNQMGDYQYVAWALLDQANRWYQDYGRADKALEAVDMALRVDRRLLTPYHVVRLLMSKHRLLKDRSAKRAELLHEAVAISESSNGDYNVKIQVYMALSNYQAMRGNYPKSWLSAQTALTLCLEANRSHDVAKFLYLIARLLFIQGRAEDAEIAANTAQSIFDQLDLAGDWGVSVKGDLITSHISGTRQEEALDLIKEVERSSTLSPNYPLELHLAYNISINNLDASQHYADKIRQIKKDMKMVGDHASMMLFGDMHLHQGDVAEAFTEYITLLISSTRSGNRLGVTMLLTRLGDIFRCRERDMEIALNCYEAATLFIRYIGAPRHLADAVVRSGLCHGYFGNVEAARSHILKAKHLFGLASFTRGSRCCEDYLDYIDKSAPKSHSPAQDRSFLLDAVPPLTLVGSDTF